MNKILVYSGLVTLVILGFALVLSSQPNSLFSFGNSEIKAGVITTLSGEMSQFGIATKNGAQLAVDEINASGGVNGKQIKLVFEDSPCTPDKAITAFDKLTQIDDVDLIIGPLCSSELLALAPLIEKNNIVTLSSTATSPNITLAGDYIFRDVPADDLKAVIFAKYIFNEAKVKEISIILANSDVSVTLKNSFEETYVALGGKVISEEMYQKGTSDVRTQLAKIKNSNSSAILMISWPVETGNILKQAKELGIKSQFYEAFEVMSDPQVKQLSGDAINGVIYIQAATVQTKEAKDFQSKYFRTYGVEAPYYSAEAYDVIKLYEEAIKNTGLQNVKDGLYKIKNYEGASGTITFDNNGDSTKPYEIGQVINGELHTIKVI